MTSSARSHMVRSVFCLLLLAGCATSPPVRYHTLAHPGGDAATTGSDAARVLVQILPVGVPEGVTRENIVLKDPGGRITVLQTDRWLAPVADDLKQLVADALWRSVRAADTYDAPVPEDATALPRYRLALRVERFDAIPGQSAVVAGSWTLRSLTDGAVHICRWAGTQPLAGPDPGAAVAALAAASQRLVGRIGDSLREALNGGADVCGATSSAGVAQ